MSDGNKATSKELQAFLKIAWKEPTAETKARYFARKQKVVMQLLVFTMKPMTAEKRALGLQGDEYEKARICLQGQNHEGFQIHNSTNNADAHLLRLFLSVPFVQMALQTARIIFELIWVFIADDRCSKIFFPN